MTRARNLADFNAVGVLTSTSTINPANLDSTGTIPSALLADVGGGIEVADQWRLQQSQMGDQDPLQTWERVDNARSGTLGTGMSYSNGEFTFPKAGIWKVEFFGFITRTTADNGTYFTLKTLTNEDLAFVKASVSSPSYNCPVYLNALASITQPTFSSNKLKLVMSDAGGQDQSTSAKVHGDSTRNECSLTFTRLGDA
jgi:hypothetical protein